MNTNGFLANGEAVRRPLPRGWVVVGLALGSWVAFVALATTLFGLFRFILGAI